MARPFYDKLDWTVVLTTSSLAAISLSTIHSISSSSAESYDLVWKQAGWFCIGFLLVALMTSIDYHIISALAYPVYASVVAALIGVLSIGEKIMGACRWIKLGPLTFQPSELAKIALILVLAKYFSDKKKETIFVGDLIVSVGFLGILVVLILQEPDLGMSILLFPIFVAIVFVAGIDFKPLFRILLFRPILITLVIAILFSSFYKQPLQGYWKLTERSLPALAARNVPGSVLRNLENLLGDRYTDQGKFLKDLQDRLGEEHAAQYQHLILEQAVPKFRLITFPFMMVWFSLKPYQQARLEAFIKPSSDPLGSGYHVTQSQIAIGSGGLWGKGYKHGTQSQLKFLPEQYTDFIFSVFSEEWGFFGSSVLLCMYLALILKGLGIALKARDKLGRLIATGVVTIFVVHMFVNVGVTTGIMPVTGLTLPLVSYGGSSIFSTSIALGLLLNVSYRRFDF
ncbi:MAG: rod shape-determining protein RodA [Proteobacteria bacterium]|nr:MAG: rod shape-determining protein RodA [Pseudomonadota bacterium]